MTPLTFGQEIELAPDRPLLVRQIIVEDCRLVRAFCGAPIVGRADTRQAKGDIAEWTGQSGTPAVNYRRFNSNDGMHITLRDGGVDAIQVRGERRPATDDDAPPPTPGRWRLGRGRAKRKLSIHLRALNGEAAVAFGAGGVVAGPRRSGRKGKGKGND